MISETQMARYRSSAQKRWRAEARALDESHQRASQIARNAAHILKETYGAMRDLFFGSLVNKDLFHPNSDLDLAVWGMNEKRLFSRREPTAFHRPGNGNRPRYGRRRQTVPFAAHLKRGDSAMKRNMRRCNTALRPWRPVLMISQKNRKGA